MDAATPGPFQKVERILFGCGTLFLLFPLWQHQYFLTGDGPTHLYNARILLELLTGDADGFFSEWYELTPGLVPNLTGHYLLALFLVFLPGWLAEKIMLSLIVLLLVLPYRAILRHFNPKLAALSCFAFPFVYTKVLHMGFFNYSLSIGLALCLFWAWLKTAEKPKILPVAALAAAMVLLYFTHAIGFVLATILIGLHAGWHMLLPVLRGELKFAAAVRQHGRAVLAAFAVAVPALLMFAVFLATAKGKASPNPASTGELLSGMFLLESLKTFRGTWTFPFPLFFLLIAGLTGAGIFFAAKKRKLHSADFLLIASILLIFGYLVAPEKLAGGGILSIRLQYLPLLLLPLWHARFDDVSWVKWTFVPALALGVLMVGARLPWYNRIAESLNDITAAESRIEEKSVVLNLSFEHAGRHQDGEAAARGIWFFIHASDYLGVEKDLVLLSNYEAKHDLFPVRWREEMNPFLHLGKKMGLGAYPAAVDIAAFEAHSGKRIDYVLTYMMYDGPFQDHENVRDLDAQLKAGYTFVFNANDKVDLFRRMP